MGEIYFDADNGAVFQRLHDDTPGIPGDENIFVLGELLTLPAGQVSPDITVKHQMDRIRNWDAQAIRTAGTVAFQAAIQADPTVRLGEPILKRMHRLGLFVHLGGMYDNGVSAAELAILAGDYPGRRDALYERQSPHRQVAYADRVSKIAGRRPQADDYDAAALRNSGLSAAGLAREFGSVEIFNDWAGMPDFSAITADELVEWGDQVAKANESMYLSAEMVNIIAARFRGPELPIIERHFGSLEAFISEVTDYSLLNDKALIEARETFLMEYKRLDDKGVTAPLETNLHKRIGKPKTDEARILWATKYLLVAACLPDEDQTTRLQLINADGSRFTSRIIAKADNAFVNMAHIEVTATSLGCEELLWPPKPPARTKYLRVSSHELGIDDRERQRLAIPIRSAPRPGQTADQEYPDADADNVQPLHETGNR